MAQEGCRLARMSEQKHGRAGHIILLIHAVMLLSAAHSGGLNAFEDDRWLFRLARDHLPCHAGGDCKSRCWRLPNSLRLHLLPRSTTGASASLAAQTSRFRSVKQVIEIPRHLLVPSKLVVSLVSLLFSLDFR